MSGKLCSEMLVNFDRNIQSDREKTFLPKKRPSPAVI